MRHKEIENQSIFVGSIHNIIRRKWLINNLRLLLNFPGLGVPGWVGCAWVCDIRPPN